jgi:hypothetical protein
MSGFSSAWLALREPYDVAARNQVVLDAVLAAFRGQGSISVVDLACGTGSTLRAIGGRLPARQSWRLVDNDLGLLGSAATLARRGSLSPPSRSICGDLELALDGPVDLVGVGIARSRLGRLAGAVDPRSCGTATVYAALATTDAYRLSPSPSMPTLCSREQTPARNRAGPALGPDESCCRIS